jgi:hypothetical protein
MWVPSTSTSLRRASARPSARTQRAARCVSSWLTVASPPFADRARRAQGVDDDKEEKLAAIGARAPPPEPHVVAAATSSADPIAAGAARPPRARPEILPQAGVVADRLAPPAEPLPLTRTMVSARAAARKARLVLSVHVPAPAQSPRKKSVFQQNETEVLVRRICDVFQERIQVGRRRLSPRTPFSSIQRARARVSLIRCRCALPLRRCAGVWWRWRRSRR